MLDPINDGWGALEKGTIVWSLGACMPKSNASRIGIDIYILLSLTTDCQHRDQFAGLSLGGML